MLLLLHRGHLPLPIVLMDHHQQCCLRWLTTHPFPQIASSYCIGKTPEDMAELASQLLGPGSDGLTQEFW